MSTEVQSTKPKHPWALTERGRPVQYTQDEVDAVLKLLAANGGKCAETSDQLRGEGINISRTALQHWRDYAFPHRYMQVRTEQNRLVAERVAGNAMERALELDKAQQEFAEKAVEKLDEVDANHLPKAVQSLANAKAQDIQSAQLLRDRPTEIVKVDLNASIETLERLKVLEPTEPVVDAEVVEDQ